jgi:uncharacterized membrane protein YfcA
MDALAFLAVGAAAGICSGVFGIGGGVVIVLALLWGMKWPIHTATGTSLAALLLPVGLLGAWEYWRRGHVNGTAALWIAVGLTLGAWAGARFAQKISGPYLRLSFGIFLALAGIYLAATAFRSA